MPSRPTHEERIQADLDELLGQLAILAKALLIRNGEFFPFGATIGKRGKFTLVTPVPESERPTAHDVVDAVITQIRSSKDTLRACGVVAMAETATGNDAVRIELEHAEGSSLVIALPYARGDFGAFTYGDLEARRAERRVWLPVTAKPARPSQPSTRAEVKSKTQRVPAKKPEQPAKGRQAIRGTRQPLSAQPALF